MSRLEALRNQTGIVWRTQSEDQGIEYYCGNDAGVSRAGGLCLVSEIKSVDIYTNQIRRTNHLLSVNKTSVLQFQRHSGSIAKQHDDLGNYFN